MIDNRTLINQKRHMLRHRRVPLFGGVVCGTVVILQSIGIVAMRKLEICEIILEIVAMQNWSEPKRDTLDCYG